MSNLTLKQANTIIEKAFATAREMKIKPLGVVVVDVAGNIISAQREDRASMFRIDIARGKAWACVALGFSGRELAMRATRIPAFFVTLAAAADGRFIPQTGGVLIRDKNGEIVGAAGATGGTGDEDEACCIAGIEQAGLIADASVPSAKGN